MTQRIKFRSVRWVNLLSYGNYWTEVRLDTGGLTLFTGKNGHGKSTIIDAINFVLFGKPFRQVKNGNLVNSVNGKDCVVEIEFDIGSREYKVLRGLRPNKFEVLVDGKPVQRLAKAKDVQKAFEETVLGYSAKTFAQVDILGAATFTPFMQLKAPQRREVIEDILSISEFGPMLEVSKRLASNARSRISEARERERILEERERGKVLLLQQAVANAEARRDEVTTELKELAEAAVKAVQDKKAKVASRETLQTAADQADEAMLRYERGRRLVRSLAEQIQSIEKDIVNLEREVPCAHCGKDLVAETRASSRAVKVAEKYDLEKRHQTVTAGLVVMQSTIEASAEIKKQYNQLNTDVAVITATLNDLKGRIANKEEQLAKLADVDMTEHKEEINQVRVELAQKREDAVTHARELNHVACVSDMLRDDGVKTMIIKTMLPAINKAINDGLQALGFPITFVLDEQFEETIKSRGRDDQTYFSFSEGEKKRIDLAILFAWRKVASMKNSVSSNILILDEVADGAMDVDGVNDFMKLLGKTADDITVLLVSHNPNMVAAFGEHSRRVMRAEKKGLFSRLTLDT